MSGASVFVLIAGSLLAASAQDATPEAFPPAPNAESPLPGEYAFNPAEVAQQGSHCFPDTMNLDRPKVGVLPVAEYAHDPMGGSTVIGGHVYRGDAYPDLDEIYFVSDAIFGRVWGIAPNNGAWQMEELLAPRSLSLALARIKLATSPLRRASAGMDRRRPTHAAPCGCMSARTGFRMEPRSRLVGRRQRIRKTWKR